MHHHPLYPVVEGGPVAYAPPNGATGNEVPRINSAHYGYSYCNSPNQSIHNPYDPHAPREPRLHEDTGSIKGSNGALPHGFAAPLPPNTYLGVPIGHPISHLGHHSSNQIHIPRSYSSAALEQPVKYVLTEEDNNIYAAFLHFRHCLQKYLHAHGDSSASVKLFWKDIYNTIESSSKTAGEFYNKY
ncbi:hypothetical protein M422DRAFT_245805 [Sphaerobolus stellatus SS14]|nr:hypothetical protein M422DRAFT_245805 [Sphaerobolus stellatus SS14]